MRLRSALYYSGVALTIAAIMAVALRIWASSLEVPFVESGDALFFTAMAKATADDGLYRFNHLGMPFGVDIVDWGPGMPLDLTALRILVRVLGSPGAATNTWWLLSLCAGGVFAAFAFRALGIRPALAFALACLFGTTPFCLLRNVVHINLVCHFIPLIALLAIRTAEGRVDEMRRRDRILVLAGCAAQGLSYVYYSFFACLILSAATVFGWLRTRRRATLAWGLAGIVLLSGATFVTMIPSLTYWKVNGKNPDLQYKSVAASDDLALRIRHLLLPIPDHPLEPFRQLAASAAREFPADRAGESALTRLGTTGSLGFLFLLGCLAGSAAGLLEKRSTLGAAAALTLVVLLVSQVGGFGSIFNLLVAPDIRAYNRIAVYLAFFSLFAVGSVLEELRGRASGRARFLVAGAPAALLLFGVPDQLTATTLREAHKQALSTFNAREEFVTRLESRLAPGAMVFQLPNTKSPVETTRTNMPLYGHAAAYLHSRTLRWSWGAISGRNGNWNSELQHLPTASLVRTLVLAGFDAVWIDRLGYDRPGVEGLPTGANPEAEVARLAGAQVEVSNDTRYSFVLLTDLRQRLASQLGAIRYAALAREALKPPVAVRYLEGFGPDTGDPVEPRRVCAASGRFSIRNSQDRERTFRFSARLRAIGPQPRTVVVESSLFREEFDVTAPGVPIDRSVLLPGRRRLIVRFSCAPQADPCFEILGAQLVDLTPPPALTLSVDEPADPE